MDISGVPIPTTPAVEPTPPAPPRGAEEQSAVRETSEAELQNGDARPDRDDRRPASESGLGGNVDMRV